MRRRPSSIIRTTVAVMGMVLLVGACSRPDPFSVGVKEMSTDVVIGASPRPEPRAPSPPPFSFIRPVPSDRPFPRTGPGPVRTGPCPELHPFAVPRHEARGRATAPPVPATYTYRTNGTFTAGDTFGVYPKQETRRVLNIERNANGYTFDVEVKMGATTTTTTYLVIPDTVVPTGFGIERADIVAGIHILTVVTEVGNARGTFRPVPPLLLMPFPAVPGKRWSAEGTDPSTLRSMSFDGVIGATFPDGPDEGDEPDLVGQARVNACGKAIAAWYVTLSNGEITGPTTSLKFEGVLAMATQYGGLSVMDTLHTRGEERLVQVQSSVTSTIDSVPKVPN